MGRYAPLKMSASRREVPVEEVVKNDKDQIDWALELPVG